MENLDQLFLLTPTVCTKENLQTKNQEYYSKFTLDLEKFYIQEMILL